MGNIYSGKGERRNYKKETKTEDYQANSTQNNTQKYPNECISNKSKNLNYEIQKGVYTF